MDIFNLSIWEFIATLFNFILLLFLLRKFLFKPILKMLDDRKTAIDKALTAADEARLEAENTEINIVAQIAAARADADAIIADAKKRGEEVRKDIIETAKLDAEKIAKAAKAQIEEEKKHAIDELKAQMADLVVLASEKVLASGLTADQEQNLMTKYIDEVSRMQ